MQKKSKAKNKTAMCVHLSIGLASKYVPRDKLNIYKGQNLAGRTYLGCSSTTYVDKTR